MTKKKTKWIRWLYKDWDKGKRRWYNYLAEYVLYLTSIGICGWLGYYMFIYFGSKI